jgi:CheY-like chemotaxis protein
MEAARVGIFEDNTEMHELLTAFLELDGHSVAAAAKSMEEAHATIDGLEPDSLDVAIVDGNLSPNTYSGADGEEITRRLREKLGGAVVVIGFSASNQVPGADYNVGKAGDPFEKIPAIIADL